MLRQMRQYAGSWMIKILLGAIVIVFIFWGVGTFNEKAETKAAVVNGDIIPMSSYIRTYNNMLEQYKKNFGGQISEEQIQMFDLKNKAIDQLISNILLIQEAKKLEFRVTKTELAESIMNYPVFQSNGRFDPRRYQLVLNANRLTPEEFEFLHQEEMLSSKMADYLLQSAKISENEAFDYFTWENTSKKIAYVQFKPDDAEEIKIGEEELAEYFEKNKETYRTEVERKVRFIQFTAKDFKNQMEVTDDEIQEYYEANKNEFYEPKTVVARHILLKLEAGATEEQVEEKRKKAVEIMEMAKKGEDFAELAKKFSEGPTKKVGGSLGKFKREDMVKPFSDKAFSMKVGEISEPVKTQFGWHIIKVEKINPEKTLGPDDVKIRISEKLKEEKAKTKAYDRAYEVYDTIYTGDELKNVADAAKMELKETEFFPVRTGPSFKLVKNPGTFAKTAFEIGIGDISEVLDLGDGYYILQPVEEKPSEIPALETVRKKVEKDLIKMKKDENAKKRAEEFLATAKKASSFEEACKTAGLNMQTSEPFTRNNAIPGIGYEPFLSEAAFESNAEKKLPENVIKGRNGYFVFSYLETIPPEKEKFAEEKAGIISRLIQMKKNRLLSSWLDERKASAVIEKFIND